jgi:hypothetical protein
MKWSNSIANTTVKEIAGSGWELNKTSSMSFFKINNVIDRAEMASTLKMHMSDCKEKVPEGRITKNGNEKTIVKRRIVTQAKLNTGSLVLYIGISFRLNMFGIFFILKIYIYISKR